MRDGYRFAGRRRLEPGLIENLVLSKRKGLQHLIRFCSRSTAALTPPEARGYFRVTSPSAAQAASFSFRAASDWPSRSRASGALPDLSNLVVTARKDSAASR